jgi:hypothetical protein
MRRLLFAVLLVGIVGPPLFAADTPATAPVPVPMPAAVPAAPCPCPPSGPPPPLIMPPPGIYPQYNLPAVYLRQRSIHDGPAGYRSAPWHPVPDRVTSDSPVRPPAAPWWPW